MYRLISPATSIVALLSVTFLYCAAANGFDDWPHWRGPQHNDQSSETGLLKEWPKGGPPQVWNNKNAGLGYAGLAIVNDQLFTMGMEDNREFVICLNANDGTEIWRTSLESLPAGGPRDGGYLRQWGDGPRGTPTVDGDHVYVLGAGGHLACLKKSDGDKVWSAEMTDFGGKVPTWGYSESLLIDGLKVVCTPGGSIGTLLALDKKTGKKIWQSKPITRILESDGSETAAATKNYSSILPVEWNNQRQYVQLTEHAVVSVHPETGDIIWRSKWPGRTAIIPSPIFDDGEIYVTSGYDVGSKLIRIDDNNKVEEVWYTKDMQNHHGGVIKVGDYYYGSSKSSYVCQNEKDGKKVWTDRNIKKGSIGYADGMFYHVQENDGKVILMEADEQSHFIKGSFTIGPQTKRRAGKGKIWTHPIIANGKLYLRDQEMIYCYDIKAK